MPFNKSTLAVRTADGRNFTTLESFSYVSLAGEWFTVPSGHETDGASVPPALWPTLPPFGDYWMPAVFHDYLYRSTQIPKDKCDSLFLEAMQGRCVPEVQVQAIYEGVRLGGWKAFRDDRESKNTQ